MKRLFILFFCALMAVSAAAAEDAPAREPLPDAALYAYYDRSLIVGDSLIVIFRNHVRVEQSENPAFFAGARFYAVASYTLRTATHESASGSGPHLKYSGMDVSLAWLMGELKPRRVFLHAGLNDDIHDHIDRADEWIDKIMALRDRYSPDTEMGFFSLTPVTRKIGPRRQRLHDEYNVWLEEKCAAVGAVFVDIASGLKGEDGFLRDDLSSDGEFHLNGRGNAIWAREMLDFARSRYEAGLWDPAEPD